MDENEWLDERARKRLERIENEKDRSRRKWREKAESIDWLAIEHARRGDGVLLQEAQNHAH